MPILALCWYAYDVKFLNAIGVTLFQKSMQGVEIWTRKYKRVLTNILLSAPARLALLFVSLKIITIQLLGYCITDNHYKPVTTICLSIPLLLSADLLDSLCLSSWFTLLISSLYLLFHKVLLSIVLDSYALILNHCFLSSFLILYDLVGSILYTLYSLCSHYYFSVYTLYSLFLLFSHIILSVYTLYSMFFPFSSILTIIQCLYAIR